ncbi:MAG: phosphatase family protein [Chitinophagaceae bacterium]|nr:phosphatase family protein [Chitinophagaceae bacterium]
MKGNVRKTGKTLWARLGLLSVEALLVGAIFFTAVFIFWKIADNIFIDKKKGFDEKVFSFLHQHVDPFNTWWMQFFTFFGKHVFLIPANLALITFYLLKKDKWYSIKIPSVAIGSTALLFLLKDFFDRPRPLMPLISPARGLSFPSGHAMSSVAFFGLLIYIIHKNVKNRYWRVALISFLVFFILNIGFSRIYLRVHYASDVIGGFCLGFIWLYVSLALLNRIEKYSNKKLSPEVEGSPSFPLQRQAGP